MTRLRAFIFMTLAFAAGMFTIYLTAQWQFFVGKLVGRAECIAFEKNFFNAMTEKMPFQWGPYTLYPHTDEKKVRVDRIKSAGRRNAGKEGN